MLRVKSIEKEILKILNKKEIPQKRRPTGY